MTVPPRLHVLTATESPRAVVLRRGPARAVASLLWDRDSGEVTPGQWLRGRIYEHRCDLSPDGRHLVIFASKGGSRAWTALSRAPWLTALLYLPQSSTWCGGGAFDDEGRLWLNGRGPEAALPDGLKPAPLDAYPHSTDGFHMGGTHLAMLERRGWRRVGGEGHEAALALDLPNGRVVEQRFVIGARNRAIVSPRFAVAEADGARREEPVWEWAGLWRGRLQVAAKGAIWEERGDGLAEVADLSDLAFEAIPAPYEGVEG